jgi:thymidylate kinase
VGFYRRVRRGYRALARREPRRVKLISGEAPPERIHRQVLALVDRLWARGSR